MSVNALTVRFPSPTEDDTHTLPQFKDVKAGDRVRLSVDKGGALSVYL